MNSPAFSSEVELKLLVDGQALELSHTNATDVILRESAAQFPATNAELIVTVDGVERRRAVFLPDGISPEVRRVVYQPLNY